MLLFLSLLILSAALTQAAKAQDESFDIQSLSLTPFKGSAGTVVGVYGLGYGSSSQVSIKFDTTEVANCLGEL